MPHPVGGAMGMTLSHADPVFINIHKIFNLHVDIA